jgi:hypothetical protein
MEAQFNYHCYTHDRLNHKLLDSIFYFGEKTKKVVEKRSSHESEGRKLIRLWSK